jgi:prepilin-type processing-associated H-X9-DG protein
MTNDTKTDKSPKPRISRLAIASGACFVVFLLFMILTGQGSFPYRQTAETLAFVFLLASLLLGIASLTQICLSKKTLRGKLLARMVIVLSTLLIWPVAMFGTVILRAYGVSPVIHCRTNFKGIGTAIIVYASDFDEKLPTAANWCDLLIEHVDVHPKSFICYSSDAEVFESSYALNKHIADMKLSDIPADVVLLFETDAGKEQAPRKDTLRSRGTLDKFPLIAREFGDTKHKIYKDRFNQCGGPEIMKVDAHQEGVNILFADGETHCIKLKDLPSLRWDIEGKVKTPQHVLTIAQAQPLLSETQLRAIGAITFIALSLIVAVFFLAKIEIRQYLIPSVGMALIAAPIGALLGFWGQFAYEDYLIPRPGLWAGIYFGFAVGICYIPIAARTARKVKDPKNIGVMIRTVGTITGIICSTLVHTTLIILSAKILAHAIIAAIPFAIIAGYTLGAITTPFLKPYCTTKENDAVAT